MNKIKLLILVKLIFLLAACNTVKEGFSSQRKNNSDEFLVEKKSPLTMPPNFNELPVPAKPDLKNPIKDNEIKDLITRKKKEDNLSKSKNISNSLEQSMLDKINNN